MKAKAFSEAQVREMRDDQRRYLYLQENPELLGAMVRVFGDDRDEVEGEWAANMDRIIDSEILADHVAELVFQGKTFDRLERALDQA